MPDSGREGDRLRSDVPLPSDPGKIVDLVAYSDQPFDARTCSVAVVNGAVFEWSLPLYARWERP